MVKTSNDKVQQISSEIWKERGTCRVKLTGN